MRNKLLIFIIILNFLLVIYGITWGLPSRWCVDEPISGALRMMANKSLLPESDFFHPTFHYFVLMIFLVPILLLFKIFGYPILAAKEAASVSWIYLSITHPNFSSAIYIAARLSSAFFACLIVYLSYQMARKCFSEKAGVFSALFLSVTAGFISEAHTAKSTTLTILMIMLTVFSSMHYVDKKTIRKYIVPFLLGGLALATKYNGGIVIFPLSYYLVNVLHREKGDRFKKKFMHIGGAIASFTAGFLIGFPAILSNFTGYTNASLYYKTRYLPQSLTSIFSTFFSGLAGYTMRLVDIFGIALFLLVTVGFMLFLLSKKQNIYSKMILLVVIPYFLLFSLNPKTFEVKYIIPIAPLLIILSSGLADKLLKLNISYRRLTIALFSFVWIISLMYTISLCNIYARKDIRYAATEWIESNVPKKQGIIIVGMPEWVVHNRLFKDYNVTFVNNSENGFDTKYNRRFSGGKQYLLNQKEVERITRDLKRYHRYFVIYPVFTAYDRVRFWRENDIVHSYGMPIKDQKIVKEFSRESKLPFWSPDIGGYEPEKIIITSGIK